jgi:DNA-binding GntR family transcriptional regulator
MSVDEAAVTISGGAVTLRTRREEVVKRIRHALLAGELKPGQRIKEAPLAESLGVSRPTLRESLQQLVHEGALVQIPHKGVHVAAPTPEELLDVAEVRLSLETMAALRLSKEPKSAAMDEVRAALDRHLAAIESGDEVQTDITHFELHRTIWEMSGSVTLRKIWPLVGSQVQQALSVDQATMRDPERDAELHRRLIRVIEGGDEAAIVDEIRAHIQSSVDEVVRRLV